MDPWIRPENFVDLESKANPRILCFGNQTNVNFFKRVGIFLKYEILGSAFVSVREEKNFDVTSRSQELIYSSSHYLFILQVVIYK